MPWPPFQRFYVVLKGIFYFLFCDIPLLIFLGRGKQMLSGVTLFLGRHSSIPKCSELKWEPMA